MPYQDQSVMLQKYVVRIFLAIFVSFTNLLSPYLIFPLFDFLVAFNDSEQLLIHFRWRWVYWRFLFNAFLLKVPF